MSKLIQLFNDIHLLIEKYEQIRKEKGDNYNLFQPGKYVFFISD